MAIDPTSCFAYWGKAKPADNSVAQYHLLPFHSLDVAAVGVAYLEQSEAMLDSFRALFDCSREDFLSWAGFLFALHDLGKFSEAFQSQRPDLVAHLKNRAPNAAMQYCERHDSLGFWLWREEMGGIVSQQLGLDCSGNGQESLMCWMRAVTGHHGMPPKSSGVVDRFFLRADKQAATYFAMEVGELLLTDGAKKIGRQGNAKAFLHASEMLSWWFAGVTVLADWLGSNTEFFPYRERPMALPQYWGIAKAYAGNALNAAGVLPVATRPGQSLQDFFSYIKEPSPLQQWAATVEVAREPQIFLLEDVTGAGKTEAAMMLAYRLMADGLANGFFHRLADDGHSQRHVQARGRRLPASVRRRPQSRAGAWP